MRDKGSHQGGIALRAWVALVAGLAATLTTIGAAHAVAPSNDSFATPRQLASSLGLVRGSNLDASKEAGEPDHAGVLGNKSVWYRWTAPRAGRVVFRMDLTEEPTFDSLLAVYQGDSVDALRTVASNDDVVPGSWAGRLAFTARAGSTYRVAVDGVSGKSGRFLLSWAMRPANDNFSAATRNAGASGLVRSDTSLATREVGEPRGQRRSVWYRWTAPRHGDVVLSTSGSLFDTKLFVYTGRTLGSLVLGAQNDDFREGVTSRVRLRVREGRSYRIAVTGFYGASGPMVLRWRML